MFVCPSQWLRSELEDEKAAMAVRLREVEAGTLSLRGLAREQAEESAKALQVRGVSMIVGQVFDQMYKSPMSYYSWPTPLPIMRLCSTYYVHTNPLLCMAKPQAVWEEVKRTREKSQRAERAEQEALQKAAAEADRRERAEKAAGVAAEVRRGSDDWGCDDWCGWLCDESKGVGLAAMKAQRP